jgi:hypothetical protein
VPDADEIIANKLSKVSVRSGANRRNKLLGKEVGEGAGLDDFLEYKLEGLPLEFEIEVKGEEVVVNGGVCCSVFRYGVNASARERTGDNDSKSQVGFASLGRELRSAERWIRLSVSNS